MKEIKVRVTEEQIIFEVGGNEFFMALPRFLEIIRRDGEAIKNEAERIARRFDLLKRLETVAGIDVLISNGHPITVVADWINVPEGLIKEFLEVETAYLAALRTDPSYQPVYNSLRANIKLIGDGGSDHPSRRPKAPEPPAPLPHPIRDLPWRT